MIMTTMGSAYWPLTLAGRILCWLLALYAFGVFGYITATIATFFLGGSASADGEQSGETPADDMSRIESELAAMRQQLAVLVARFDGDELLGRVVREVRPVAGGGSSMPPSGAGRHEIAGMK